MKYSIAYGRNLDIKRMKERCPHCVLVGKTVLKDWQLAFKRYITVEPCRGKEVPVGVWQIDDVAEKELDKIEGYPTLYKKEIVEIELDGMMVKAIVYVINDTHTKYPDKAYLERVMIGYNDFNFDKKFIYDAIDRLPTKKVYILTDNIPEKYIEACKKVGIETEYGLEYKQIDGFDGLLIPGGGDIDPKFYEQENYASVKIDTARDEVTFEAIKYCVKNHKPILGICLGVQYINVALGGTLKQDIPNHKNVNHKIKVEENNILYDYVGCSYITNSKHHQCIDKLGLNLKVVAKSDDGIIEAIEDKENKILGIQWHAEEMEDNSMFEIFKTML